MKRQIVKLWAEYKSDESPHQSIEPISLSEAKKLFEEEQNNLGSCESITPAQQNNRINREYISKERIDHLEEVIKKIEHAYREHQDMSPGEKEYFISDGFE